MMRQNAFVSFYLKLNSAFITLQDKIRLSMSLFVLFIISINYLQTLDEIYLAHLNIPSWTDSINIRHLARMIIISIDLSYLFISILCRKAIYRRVGDYLLPVILEVISFSSTFFYDGIILNVVWIIPIIIYLLRVIITMFTFQQPNHNLILKNNQSKLNGCTPSSQFNYKRTPNDIEPILIKQQDFNECPPSYSLHASTNEIIYSMNRSENNKTDSPIDTKSYIFGASEPPQTKQRTDSSLRLGSFGINQYPEEKDSTIKDDLITRFRTLTL